MSGDAATELLREEWRACPDCFVERADWEHDAGGYLPTCPNCGSAAAPTDGLLALCDRLDQAREAATPGPWEATEPRADGGAYIDTVQVRLGDGSAPWIGHAHRERDAALIVAAVNAVPELTAAVRWLLADRQAVQRVEALAEAVEREWRGQYRAEADDVLDVAARIRRALGEDS